MKGFRKELTEDDMYGTLKPHDSGMLGDRLQKAWDREVATKKDPSLWIAMARVFGVEFLLYASYFGFIEFVVK